MLPASVRFGAHETCVEGCELAVHVQAEHDHSPESDLAALEILKTSFHDCCPEICDVHLTESCFVVWQLMAEHNCLVA